MIYKVALNPSLNKTIEVEELIYDELNKTIEERVYAGGKGLDVSRIMKELDGQTLLSTSGSEVNSLEVATFYNKIKEIPMNSKVVISGNTPMRYK
jgi:fructose-1-phosphate kinase PfkB-like protein